MEIEEINISLKKHCCPKCDQHSLFLSVSPCTDPECCGISDEIDCDTPTCDFYKEICSYSAIEPHELERIINEL